MQSFTVYGLGRILLFYPKVREIVTVIFLFTPDKKPSRALKEEENNSVQGNLKLSAIVLMIREHLSYKVSLTLTKTNA